MVTEAGSCCDGGGQFSEQFDCKPSNKGQLWCKGVTEAQQDLGENKTTLVSNTFAASACKERKKTVIT